MFTKHKWKLIETGLIEAGTPYILVDCDPANDKFITLIEPNDAENVDILIAEHNKLVDLMAEEIAKCSEES